MWPRCKWYICFLDWIRTVSTSLFWNIFQGLHPLLMKIRGTPKMTSWGHSPMHHCRYLYLYSIYGRTEASIPQWCDFTSPFKFHDTMFKYIYCTLSHSVQFTRELSSYYDWSQSNLIPSSGHIKGRDHESPMGIDVFSTKTQDTTTWAGTH